MKQETSLQFTMSAWRCKILTWVLVTALLVLCVPSVGLAQQPTATIIALSGTVFVNGQKQGIETVLSTGDVIETQSG